MNPTGPQSLTNKTRLIMKGGALMYTIIIKTKKEADMTLAIYLACIRLGVLSIKAEFNDESETISFKNLNKKKAIKIISKIKSIKNFEQIATYEIIKED